jgi:hypothetical protein
VNDDQTHSDEGTTDRMSLPIEPPIDNQKQPTEEPIEQPTEPDPDTGVLTGELRTEPAEDTAEQTDQPPTRQRPPGGGLVAGVSGVVLCVLLITAVGLVIAKIISRRDGQPGPGAIMVGSHVAGLLVGFGCYRFSRGRGARALLGLLGVLVVAGLLLWFFWWSPT